MRFKSTPFKQYTIKPAKDKRNVLVKFDAKGFYTTKDKDLAAKLESLDGVSKAGEDKK